MFSGTRFVVTPVVLFPLIVICSAGQAFAAKGVVSNRISGCDYFIVSTAKGYDVLEWFGGYDPDKGDVLVGDYETYGMQDIHDTTADESLTVWVEDYWLSKGDALEKLVEQCE
jgi:hypothetical protein